MKAGGAFKKSGWGGDIVDVLKPGANDIVIEGKRGLCGFASTNLVSREGLPVWVPDFWQIAVKEALINYWFYKFHHPNSTIPLLNCRTSSSDSAGSLPLPWGAF